MKIKVLFHQIHQQKTAKHFNENPPNTSIDIGVSIATSALGLGPDDLINVLILWNFFLIVIN